MVNAGAPERVVMEGSDLKTRSVFDPYYLVIPANFHEAARRLAVTFAGRFEANEYKQCRKSRSYTVGILV